MNLKPARHILLIGAMLAAPLGFSSAQPSDAERKWDSGRSRPAQPVVEPNRPPGPPEAVPREDDNREHRHRGFFRNRDGSPAFPGMMSSMGNMFEKMLSIEQADRELEALREEAKQRQSARLQRIIAAREELQKLEKVEFAERSQEMAERMIRQIEEYKADNPERADHPLLLRTEQRLRGVKESGGQYEKIRETLTPPPHGEDGKGQKQAEPSDRVQRLLREYQILQDRQRAIREELRSLGIYNVEGDTSERRPPNNPQPPPPR